MNTITSSLRSRRGRSGQALIEFTLVIFMLVAILFALIDIGRIIYEKQILVNVAREGANLASRGAGNTQLEIMSNAASAVVVSAAPLALDSAKGSVIISAVNNSNNVITVAAQVFQGSLNAVSKIGSVGSVANLPNTGSTTFPALNQTIYVSEVFYSYTPLTPLFKMMNFTPFSTNYDVAYF